MSRTGIVGKKKWQSCRLVLADMRAIVQMSGGRVKASRSAAADDAR
jgi:hypothetical protein